MGNNRNGLWCMLLYLVCVQGKKKPLHSIVLVSVDNKIAMFCASCGLPLPENDLSSLS